jgi:predicted O-linked N-acetylglucosamine transferase (SPINDLY family)
VERARETLLGSGLALAILPATTKTKRFRDTYAAAKRALATDRTSTAAWARLGHAFFGLGYYRRALAAYDKVLAIEPDSRTAWERRLAAMRAIGKNADSASPIHDPKTADAWALRAGAYWFSRRYPEAADASNRALALDPGHVGAQRIGVHCRLTVCDWSRREEDKRIVSEGVKKGAFVVKTVDHRSLCDDEAELRLGAELEVRRIPQSFPPLWRGERYRHDRIRIAYLSTDFRIHAVSSLIVGCLERHDKTRFETIAVSFGIDDGSEVRKRIKGAFDRFIDAQDTRDRAVAETLRELEVDIAIDLNGYSGERRTEVLAHRPAPIQVNYLGYPGTMALPFMDYIIADRFVIPRENEPYFAEKIAYLPHSYLPNDDRRPIAAETPTRAAAHLPEKGFVFACANAAYKIAPEIFDVWMRLLTAVEGSVLWLQQTNPAATANLRREAAARGVAPERLLFAHYLPRAEDHLARLRLADLFLDTLPFNAHSTACDALWAGLPVLTCMGHAFAGRVGASLLHAVGLPELVTASLGEYETLAQSLALSPERLSAIRAKLLQNRATAPLFDTARHTRYLESAYATMVERLQSGQPPASFLVDE